MATITIPSDPKLLAPALYDAMRDVAGRGELWEELSCVQQQPWLHAAQNLFNNFVMRSDGREPARLEWEAGDEDTRRKHAHSHSHRQLGLDALSERSQQRQRAAAEKLLSQKSRAV